MTEAVLLICCRLMFLWGMFVFLCGAAGSHRVCCCGYCSLCSLEEVSFLLLFVLLFVLL